MKEAHANRIAEAERALQSSRETGDRAAEAEALQNLGEAWSSAGWVEKAIGYFEQALALARELGNRSAEAVALSRLGLAYSYSGQSSKAIPIQLQALTIVRALDDREGEGAALNNLGLAYSNAGHTAWAIEVLEKAVAIARDIGESAGEAMASNNLANAYVDAGRHAEAIAMLEKALASNRRIDNRRSEAITLGSLASAYSSSGRRAEAMVVYEQALEAAIDAGDVHTQSFLLSDMGALCANTSQYARASAYYERCLAIARETGVRASEMNALIGLGANRRMTSRIAEAIALQEQALVIARELGNRSKEGHVLIELGHAHHKTSDYAKAIEYTLEGLALFRELQDPWGEATALNNLGTLYWELRQLDKAREFYERALVLLRATGHHHEEAVTLNNLGSIHREQGNGPQSVEYYEQALQLARSLGDRALESSALGNLAVTRSDLGQYAEAIDVLQQALAIQQAIGNREHQGTALFNLATMHSKLGQHRESAESLRLAAAVQREIGNRAGEAAALTYLMVAAYELGQLRLAIALGKQAVATTEDIREGMSTLDEVTRRTFLEANEPRYRFLADLLITADRLAEAQQVLNLLKEEEFFAFVRRDAGHAVEARLAFTPAEEAWSRRYREIGDRLTALGRERRALLEIEARTAEQEERLDALERDLAVAGEAFHRFVSELEDEVSRRVLSTEKLEQVKDTEALMATLRQLGEGTVALYTLVTDDKLRLILITPEVIRSFEMVVRRGDLNTTIAAFRDSLTTAGGDPRPWANTMYHVLLGPLEADLRGANATTLMWSLDGALRYLPLAALHDGERYVVERFRNVVLTPASNANLKDAPAPAWRALGLGVTRSHTGFAALPAVRRELEGIIRDAAGRTDGVLPGLIGLDETFTRRMMLRALRDRYEVVHIASHFRFKPGNEIDSYLLLGDGGHMTVADVRKLQNPFGGVDLLTLSACDTARGGTGEDGREVEGFAVLAQRKGAKAVIATLWPVADESTSELMRTFYRVRETSSPRLSKAEALRQAQLSLLRSSAYAEPFYWAPFTLIGNWL